MGKEVNGVSRSRFEVSLDVRASLTATGGRPWAISEAFGRGPSARRPPYLLQNCARTGRLVDAASAVNVWGLGQTLAVPCYRHNMLEKHSHQQRAAEWKLVGCVAEHVCHVCGGEVFVLKSREGGVCAVQCERCPRFPLRRQNKEATRSTPRTRRPVYRVKGTR